MTEVFAGTFHAYVWFVAEDEMLHESASVVTVPFETTSGLSKMNTLPAAAALTVLMTLEPVVTSVAPFHSPQLLKKLTGVPAPVATTVIGSDERRMSSPD